MRRGVALSVFFCAVSADHPLERDLSVYTWQHYKKEFGRDGDAGMEAFHENLKLIQEHNANADKEWFATVNEFTDFTSEQLSPYVSGLKRGAPTFGGGKQLLRSSAAALPDHVDWRDTPGVVTPVRNQGGCGSCWAFSAAETLESHLAIATGQPAIELSVQQITSCAPDLDHCGGSGGCDGSTQPLAYNYTVTAGITTAKSYPYTQMTGTCDTSKIVPVAYMSGYVTLPANDYTALLTAVALEGPVSVSIGAGGNKFSTYGGGVFSCDNFVMNHAVQLVGYGTDSGKDYWLIRNSWGSGWGESGYIRFRRHGEGKEPCGTDSKPQDGDACAGDTAPRKYCGECALLSSSSYPTGMTMAAAVVV